MFENLPPIYFYLPNSKLLASKIPQNTDAYWQWLCSQSIPAMQGGCYTWTIQTYIYLSNYGLPCQLVETMPDEGIVLAHRDFLDDYIQPTPNLLIVCLRADVDRHPYAQLHIVQNPYQTIPKRLMTLWQSYFIPYWTQSSLIARDSQRGDKFETVAFIGNEVNLVPEFRDRLWQEQLKSLGLEFIVKLTHLEWNNYSDIDVVVAVRAFGCENPFKGKPASKLYNAWHAGTPAILGYECAFRSERKSALDYLEATSLDEAIACLTKLQDNIKLRREMIENGRVRAKETHPDKIVARWQNFLIDVAVPEYKNWCLMSTWQQQLFIKARNSFIKSRPAYYKLKSQVNSLVRQT